MGGISLEFIPPISRDKRNLLKDFCAQVPELIELRNDVRVTIVPAPTVGDKHSGYGFGVFLWPGGSRSKRRRLRIMIGAECGTACCEEFGDSDPRCAEFTLLHTLAHELVHYCQWRDGKEPTERGVDRQANSLIRKYTDKYECSQEDD